MIVNNEFEILLQSILWNGLGSTALFDKNRWVRSTNSRLSINFCEAQSLYLFSKKSILASCSIYYLVSYIIVKSNKSWFIASVWFSFQIMWTFVFLSFWNPLWYVICTTKWQNSFPILFVISVS